MSSSSRLATQNSIETRACHSYPRAGYTRSGTFGSATSLDTMMAQVDGESATVVDEPSDPFAFAWPDAGSTIWLSKIVAVPRGAAFSRQQLRSSARVRRIFALPEHTKAKAVDLTAKSSD